MKQTQHIVGYWMDYVDKVKDALSSIDKNLTLTDHHYSDMMQSYISRVSIKDAVKKLMLVKIPVNSGKTKKKGKIYL